MNKIFQELGNLLFGCIPTILLFVALHYYLKWVLYRPLQRTLDERNGRIAGRKAAAEQVLAAAEQKLAGYEASLRQRRLENYKLIETRRQEALQLGHTHIANARQQASQAMVEARQRLAAQSTEGHAQLRTSAERLAQQIVTKVLHGGARPQLDQAPGVGA
ncbi:MAG: hypothetical protein ACRD0Y_11085 [Terriglobales bacterium]